MPPCCNGKAGAGHEGMLPWLDQLLIEEEEDHEELLDELLSLAKEMADPVAAAS
jgi:hypothetical protein